MSRCSSEIARRLRPSASAWIALLLAALLPPSCGPAPGRGGSSGPSLTPPVASDASFGTVGSFRLIERSGRAVGLEDLAGEPWLACFIFTRCSTMCPGITRQMARAQGLLADTDARLVSFSVDPRHDTPEVLRAYAEAVAGADAERWLFLTGDQDAIHALIRESFLLPVEMDPDPAQDPGLLVSHRSNLVAIDGEGRIRGYYDGESDAGTEAAVERIRFLASGATRGVSPLPKLNASLNALAALLLAAGFLAIRRGRRELHGRLMSAAFLVSAAFLASYLYYHLVVIPAQGGPVRFRGVGWTRPAYLALLGTHVVGAIVNLPMVLRTLWLARRGRWADHRRWARRTFPLWMYVSVTGVLVYLTLYAWNPPVA